MSDRHHRIRLLCQTRHEHLPSPPGTRTHDQPGPVPTHRITCPACQAAEKRMPACSRCEGKGTIAVDRYLHERPDDERVTPVSISEQRTTMTSHEIDRWLERQTTGGKSWEERRAKPYDLLERALSIVQVRHVDSYMILHALYWRGIPTTFRSRNMRDLEADAIRHVDESWPRRRDGTPLPVKLPAWLEEHERGARDRQILELVGQGVSYREVAATLGVSRWTVRRAVEGRRAA